MKLIHFTGDTNYSAGVFHNRLREGDFNLKRLATKLSKEKDQEMVVGFKDGRSKESGYLKLYEFGDVDTKFVEFVREQIQSEDMLLHSDFFVLEN